MASDKWHTIHQAMEEEMTFIQQRRAEQRAIEEEHTKKMIEIYERAGIVPAPAEPEPSIDPASMAIDTSTLDIFIHK